jgi:hypothetical protein
MGEECVIDVIDEDESAIASCRTSAMGLERVKNATAEIPLGIHFDLQEMVVLLKSSSSLAVMMITSACACI